MPVSALRFGPAVLATATVLLICLPCAAQVSPGFSTTRTATDQAIDRAIERECALMQMLKTRTPLVETYLQDLKFDPQEGPIPVDDHYFFGRMDLADSVDRRNYLPKEGGFRKSLLGGFERLYKIQYQPMGFAWMIFADRDHFDRETYNFRFAHREFLGDVRCLVFEVTPKKGTGNSRFHGRVWIEDQQYNIVRLNGIYGPEPHNRFFFHMDSWRLNLVPGYWVPAYIYSEEGDSSESSVSRIAFKAQTRLWGYDLPRAGNEGDHTDIIVDPTDAVKDQSPTAQDPSPLQAQRLFMRQAEENVIERLQNAGLISPPSDADKVLETVVNNLLISNNIDLQFPVHVRVMLTSPLETFSVGYTIVVSRGVLDVLPDEASLAAVLAHELGHIVLGHTVGSRYAFSDRLLFSDESTYRNLGFRHVPAEETAADAKAIELLKNSPYKQNLASPGLFLREVANLGTGVSALCTPHLGRGLMDNKGRVTAMVALMNSAPALNPNKLDQTSALPLGARVKLNAWDDRIELLKPTSAGITSARDKMPLEITPFFPHMTRYGEIANGTATASAAPASK
ncbi:MAG TPA: M48 family metalloprotease [Candidatus Sulfotelmatobacter sp.]|nr:M48 family metalloprotease [Candidatus Sulfotelmatobacter sp.]